MFKYFVHERYCTHLSVSILLPVVSDTMLIFNLSLLLALSEAASTSFSILVLILQLDDDDEMVEIRLLLAIVYQVNSNCVHQPFLFTIIVHRFYDSFSTLTYK